jgi:hypothetical protein
MKELRGPHFSVVLFVSNGFDTFVNCGKFPASLKKLLSPYKKKSVRSLIAMLLITLRKFLPAPA